ncbi:WYL domain-containing protein, partial [Propionibacterium freudenreichii]|nr:WYL domain-containing protein [Propionibacterium freudenreichii]
MLAEVPYLQAHPGVSVTEVARAFGIKKRQVLADLDVLWMCGLPGGLPGDLIEIDMEAVQGEGIIRLTNAEVLSRPMRFTADEATSLIVALRAVEGLTSGATASAARRA